MYEQDLALNNLQRLIYHKTQANQTSIGMLRAKEDMSHVWGFLITRFIPAFCKRINCTSTAVGRW